MPPTFDYYNNSIIYISECVPFPDPRSAAYLAAITDEIEKLVTVSHGHAAVLFTSYNVMGRVYATLKNRLPFPMFRLDKGGVREIERFKQSGNGVLFASGAFWEANGSKSLIIIPLSLIKRYMNKYRENCFISNATSKTENISYAPKCYAAVANTQ